MEINATIVVQTALFLFLMLWLSKVVFAPVLRLFDERERRIDGAKSEALALEKTAHDKLQMVEERMRQGQAEARALLLQLKGEGAKIHRELIEHAKEESRKKMDAARQTLLGDMQKARGQLEELAQANARLLVDRLSEGQAAGSYKGNSGKMEAQGA